MKKFFPVIHVVDVNQAISNVEIAIEADSDGIFLISHGYMDYMELLMLGKKIKSLYPSLWIGYNFLDLPINHFFERFKDEYNLFVDAIWFDDSKRGVDKAKADDITSLWKNSSFKGEIFGGVAFKYVKQPGSLVDAVKESMGNMSVITTSGDGTGQSARPYKIKKMFEAISDGTPLAIASGIRIDNLKDYIEYVDYFLVSTGISIDHSNLNKEKTIELSNLIHQKNMI